MQLDRDAIDRHGCLDRVGGIGIPALLAAYPVSEASVYARFQIAHHLSGYPDTESEVHAALLLALAAYADSGTSIYARLKLDHNLSGSPDTDSSEYARFQITQLLKVPTICTQPAYYGREQLDRAGLDRRYTQVRSCPPSFGTVSSLFARLELASWISSASDSESSIFAWLRLDHLLQGTPDTDSSIRAALLLALASYIESDSNIYARLQIGHNCAVIADCESSEYARFQINNLLKTITDTDSSEYARLRIDQLCQAIANTVSDVYSGLAFVESITFIFSGTLAIGKTLCIDGRKFSVVNDGVNAIGSFSGEFPAIYQGTNTLVYTDSEGSRTVQLVVLKRDRKV